jgi:hypothetical protein
LGTYATLFVSANHFDSLPSLLRRRQSGSKKGGQVHKEETIWLTNIHHGRDPDKHPLWPSEDTPIEMGMINLWLPNPSLSATPYWFPWKVIAEGMEEVRGAAIITQNSSMIHVDNFAFLEDIDWAGKAEDQRFDELKRRFNI